MNKGPSVIIITGLSGAGKSVAIKSIEDFGGFCVDNMPAVLIEKFIRLIGSSDYSRSLVALGVDVRSRAFMDDIILVLNKITKQGFGCRIIFLEASENVLIRRFSESRHRHPLSGSGLTLKDTLKLEREKLEALRRKADVIIDTSGISPHGLKQRIKDMLFHSGSAAMAVNIISFGFKYGLPEEADMVIDARFLPNPFYDAELSGKDGTDEKVREFVMENPVSGEFVSRYCELLDFLLPNFISEGRAYLNIAVGCTGGRHRSVVVSRLLAGHIETGNACRVIISDRDRSR